MSSNPRRTVEPAPSPPLSSRHHPRRLPLRQACALGIAAAAELPADAVDATRQLILAVIRWSTGVRLDPANQWSALRLAQLGCPLDLATEFARLLLGRPSPSELATVLAQREVTTPREIEDADALDPTVEISLVDWW